MNAIVAAEGKEDGPKGIPPTRTIRLMSPGALQTLGTPLLVGRDFTWEELHNQRNVAMVSESFARAEWSTVEGAIGKRVLVGTSQTWQEVIGVVADVYDDGADRPAPLIVYWPARLQDYVAGPLLPTFGDLRDAQRENGHRRVCSGHPASRGRGDAGPAGLPDSHAA